MEDKDFILIYDNNGNETQMEIVFSFENNNINYIIYRNNISKQLYAAKYINDINEDFDSNLTQEELSLCNNVFERLQNDNK